MSDYNSTTTTTTTPGYTNPAAQPHAGATHTSHIRETQTSTNWFAWMLGGAVVAVGIAAFVYTGNDTATTNPTPAATGNNVTIEAPAAATEAPAVGTEAPAAAPVAPVAPEAPVATQPNATAPAAAPDAPAAAEPVAPAPEAVAPAPTGN